jgi:hypothetical protein
MSAETELYAVLSGSAGIGALVSTRIYPDAIPEDQALPALVFARTGTESIIALDGSKIAETARLSISAWATTRTSAEAIADAVETALDTALHPAENRVSGFDGELGLFAATLECSWFLNT